jgi:hypothetical protein
LVSAASFTKQDLIAIDLETEIFLHELKSTGNHFAWSKEGRFKGKVKKLIEILQEKYSLAEKSKLQFFVHLGYRVTLDLKNYRLGSGIAIQPEAPQRIRSCSLYRL